MLTTLRFLSNLVSLSVTLIDTHRQNHEALDKAIKPDQLMSPIQNDFIPIPSRLFLYTIYIDKEYMYMYLVTL